MVSSRFWIIALLVAVSAVCAPSAARADDAVPPPPPSMGTAPAGASESTPATPPAHHACGGCPYSGHGHCCRGGMVGMATGTTAVLTLGAAVVLQVLAVVGSQYASQMESGYANASSNWGIANDRNTLQDAAIGLFIGGGVLAAGMVIMSALRGGHCHRHQTAAPAMAAGVTPNSVSLAFRF